MNKSESRRTLEDFSKKIGNHKESNTSTNETMSKDTVAPEIIAFFDDRLREYAKELVNAMDQRLNEFQSKISSGDRRLLSKKRNDRVIYINDEVYPTFQKFKNSPDESLKQTLKKVAGAAEKYLELAGGSKSH